MNYAIIGLEAECAKGITKETIGQKHTCGGVLDIMKHDVCIINRNG